MATPTITMTGNLTDDPDLQYGRSGKARATFTVACGDRKKNDDGDWEDGDQAFVRCTLWEEQAEQFTEGASKGTTVTVHGRLVMRSYEKDGQRRQSVECRVFDVAIAVTRAQSASGKKVKRDSGGGSRGRSGGGRSSGGGDSWDDDPWASAPGTAAAGNAGNGYDDEPPF